MRVSIGADHGGADLRRHLVAHLAASGRSEGLVDHGTDGAESVDYPDFAQLVGRDVAAGRADAGVLVCTSGIGMSITANKIPGVRAALVHFLDDAETARRHNDANVLVLAGKRTSPEEAARLLDTFLTTGFDGGRHARRVNKIERPCSSPPPKPTPLPR